jgi:hypothetical protein
MRHISDADVYRYYLGNLVVGAMYNSPLPNRNDKTPSFGVYEKNGELRWRDHGLPNQFGYTAANLVQHLKGIELTHKGYYDAIRLIEREVKMGMLGKPPTQLRSRFKGKTTPYVKTRAYRDYELAYWARFGINEELLLAEQIEALDYMTWDTSENDKKLRSTVEDPIFIYWWKRTPASWKMYRPLADKKVRFRQENISGVIEGWQSLMEDYKANGKFDYIFNVSSTKDRLVIKNLNLPFRYGVINPRGEADRQDLIVKIPEVRKMSDHRISMYDADDAGYKGAKVLHDLSTGAYEGRDVRGLLDGEKDFSDFVDSERGNHSYKELEDIILNLLQY